MGTVPGVCQRRGGPLERKPVTYGNCEHALSEELDQGAEPSASGTTCTARMVMSLSAAGRSAVIVASRPLSRTARTASPEPARAALAATSTPPPVSRRTRSGQVRPVIVENGAGPHRGYSAGAVRARRGDDRCPAVRGQLDEHTSGHAASAMHQDGLPGTDLERVADRLVGGERRDRQRRGGIEWHCRGQDGNMTGGGDVLLGPGPLRAQRHRMRGHPVARLDSRYLVSDRGNEPGRL